MHLRRFDVHNVSGALDGARRARCGRAPTRREASHCERDDDCTYLVGKCTSMRADFKPPLDKKLQDLGTCLDILVVPICKDTRAICFEKRCRVRGQEDKAE